MRKDDWNDGRLYVQFNDDTGYYRKMDGISEEVLECRRLDMVPGDALMEGKKAFAVPIGYAIYAKQYHNQISLIGMLSAHIDSKEIYMRLVICKKGREKYFLTKLKGVKGFK